MAITLTIAVGSTTVANLWETSETLAATLNLRASPYSGATYSANSHLGDGVYDFLNVASGEYKLYNGGTELTKFGIIKVGENAVLLSGNQTATGTKTFSDNCAFSSALSVGTTLQVNTIEELTAGLGVTLEGITFLNGVVYDAIGFNVLPTSSVTPTTATQLTTKSYVDGLVAAVNIAEFQQGDNRRRIIYNGIEESGKVYTTIENAIANIGVPTVGARYYIDLERGQVSYNSLYSNVFEVSHSDLSSMTNGYCVLHGGTRNGTHLMIGSSGDSASLTLPNLSFENATIYMSTANISTARTYNGINFTDCTIYIYENVTFTNCEFWNCKIYSTTAKTVTLTGTGYCLNTVFSNSVTESGYTGQASYVDSIDTTATMPTAPVILPA